MKIRNLLFIGLASAVLFAGCKEDEIQESPSLKVEPASLELFSAEGGALKSRPSPSLPTVSGRPIVRKTGFMLNRLPARLQQKSRPSQSMWMKTRTCSALLK